MNRITYEEFREEVEKLGYKVAHTSDGMIRVKSDFWLIATVGKDARFHIMTYRKEIVTPELEKARELSMRLAYTPLDEREGRYYLRTYATIMKYSAENYLNYYKLDGRYMIDNKNDNDHYQTIFTKEEIDKLNEKYNVLDSFRMEEVK